MLRIVLSLAVLVLAASIAAPAFAEPPEPGSATTGNKVYSLASIKGSSESGTVALQPFGKQTEVEIHLLHWKPGVSQTANINAGSCSQSAPKAKYPLRAVRNGFSETLVEVPLSDLTNAGLSLDVQGAAYVNL